MIELRDAIKNGKVKHYGMRSVIQAGDELIPPRLRGSQNRKLFHSPEPIERVGYAGDWLDDDELSELLREGRLGTPQYCRELEKNSH